MNSVLYPSFIEKKNAFDPLRSSPREVWGMRHVMLHRSALVGAESPGN